MFDKIKKFFKKTQVEEPEEDSKEEVAKDIPIDIKDYGLFIKVDIKEDCNLMEYVPIMRKKGQEWVEDKIPNATLLDKGININKKTIYLFDKDNISYSIFISDQIIHINERIKTENNHIDERIINIFKNDDNYRISRMKHDESRSTYYVKGFEKKDPDFKWFQLGRENAINLSKEILSNLEKIPFLHRIINLNDIYNYLELERKIPTQEIKPIKLDETIQKEKIKEKK